MGRERKGSVMERSGKLYARVQFTDEGGRRRDLWRRVPNRKEAREAIKRLLREVEDYGGQAHDAHRMTVGDLISHFEAHYFKPAEYVGDRKVSGVRSVTPVTAVLKVLREHLGKRSLGSLTYADIRAFRELRLKTPTRHGRQRAIATVNRELSKLRRMLNIALREGWVKKNPFNGGDGLISTADETQRERVLSRAEEERILAACDSEPQRHHLPGILKIALDCALRRGEITSLLWGDVDFERGTITVRAFNTKTARTRVVAMTVRVREDLKARSEGGRRDGRERIFNVRNVRKSFSTVCRVAGVRNFRLHDCRHTAITRMIRAGLPPVEVMRVSGHTTMSAFYRYANLDSDAVFRAAAALDAFHAQGEESSGASESVN